MASHNAARAVGGGSSGPCSIKRLWSDWQRVEQVSRFGGLRLQICDVEGRAAWEEARLRHRQLPADCRIDLPSAQVFSRFLGLCRAAAQLSERPMKELTLSLGDIATLLGMSKSTVAATVRWLGTEPITTMGVQVAEGLGWITRAKRTGKAYVANRLRDVYRTSLMTLTLIGRGTLGLIKDTKSRAAKTRHTWGKQPRTAHARPHSVTPRSPRLDDVQPTFSEAARAAIRSVIDKLGP